MEVIFLIKLLIECKVINSAKFMGIYEPFPLFFLVEIFGLLYPPTTKDKEIISQKPDGKSILKKKKNLPQPKLLILLVPITLAS